MLTFADAKRVIETTKQHSPAIAGLCLELIAMLEESTAAKFTDYEKRIKEEEASRKKAQLFASKNDCSIELEEARAQIEKLEKELLQYRTKKKPGRPKKAETYKSEVEDLREDFGIKDVARELANMKED